MEFEIVAKHIFIESRGFGFSCVLGACGYGYFVSLPDWDFFVSKLSRSNPAYNFTQIRKVFQDSEFWRTCDKRIWNVIVSDLAKEITQHLSDFDYFFEEQHQRALDAEEIPF